MRLPRDLSGDDLIKLLRRHYGYRILRQRGSHVSLTVEIRGKERRVTVPLHRQLRVGTLHSLLSDVAQQFELTRDEVWRKLLDQ